MNTYDQQKLQAAADKRRRRAQSTAMRRRLPLAGTAASLGVPINPPAPTTPSRLPFKFFPRPRLRKR